jgi:hypothetical protein
MESPLPFAVASPPEQSVVKAPLDWAIATPWPNADLGVRKGE